MVHIKLIFTFHSNIRTRLASRFFFFYIFSKNFNEILSARSIQSKVHSIYVYTQNVCSSRISNISKCISIYTSHNPYMNINIQQNPIIQWPTPSKRLNVNFFLITNKRRNIISPNYYPKIGQCTGDDHTLTSII